MAHGKEKQYNTPEVTIYGTGDSAISFKELTHKRDDNLQWYKISITATKDLFKTKFNIYIEWNELIELLLLIEWKKDEQLKFIRNKRTSNTDKSFSAYFYNGNLFVAVDVKDENKLNFRLNELEKVCLKEMIINQLIKEIKRKYKISFNSVKLLQSIDTIRLNDNKNSKNSDNKVSESSNNSNKSKSKGNTLSYINTFNGKSFENKIEDIPKEIYDYIKKIENNKKDVKLDELLKKLKSKLKDNEWIKFLSLENIETIKTV